MTSPVSPSVADILIAISEHIDEFADAMPTLAGQGCYWWFRPSDNSFHATQTRNGNPGDFYLFDASPPWQEQWGGDWEAAALDLINALDAALKRPVEGSE